MAGSRQVNDMLHNLRGEHFRHAQNQRRSRAHLSSSTPSSRIGTVSSLPLDILSLSLSSEMATEPRKDSKGTQPPSSSKYSGPAPPKSWTVKRFSSQDVNSAIIWRKQALSLIFRGWKPLGQRVLPLTLLCISKVLSWSTADEFVDEILPCIPPHIRVELLRYSAIFSPLSDTRLAAMMTREGHIEGELIVVGPDASLSEEHFLHPSSPIAQSQSPSREDHDWDSDDPSPVSLRLLALISTKLAISTLLSLPPTITHMALIRLPLPIPLHRLPTVCPLVEVLDISYNSWLNPPLDETVKSLERLDWGKWRQLQTLGIRECSISTETIAKVNQGRWNDVEIVQ